MTQLSELLKQVKNLEIKTKNIVEGMESGAYRSRFRGGGIEFSEVREYAAGDDARRIDWNVMVSSSWGGRRSDTRDCFIAFTTLA